MLNSRCVEREPFFVIVVAGDGKERNETCIPVSLSVDSIYDAIWFIIVVTCENTPERNRCDSDADFVFLELLDFLCGPDRPKGQRRSQYQQGFVNCSHKIGSFTSRAFGNIHYP